MTYRILADENVEQATVNSLRKLGHDMERLDEITELGLGADDRSIARYAREHDRLILTQDDDFSPSWTARRLQASFFSGGKRCRRAKSKTPFTRCRSILTSLT